MNGREASIDSLLCTIQERDIELKLQKEKSVSLSKELISERQISQRYLKLLLEQKLADKPGQKPAREKKEVEVVGEQASGSDVETDSEALAGRSLCTADLPRISSGPGRQQSRLEADDVVFTETQCHPVPTMEAFHKVGFESGIKVRTLPPERKQTVKSENVDGNVAPVATKESSKLEVDGKLLAEVKDAIINGADAEASGDATLAAVHFPEVSNDLLSKVMQQNGRLKKLLRQIIDTQGLSVQQFLERSEYIETIEHLKLELTTLQTRIVDQQEVMKADDNELRHKCDVLVEKVRKLEQNVTVQQTLIEVYTAECVKLKQEIRQLQTANVGKLATAACDSTDQSQQSVSSQPMTSASDQTGQSQPTVVNERVQAQHSMERVDEFCQLRSKYGEMEKFYREKLRNVEGQLATKTENESRLASQNEKLQIACKQTEMQLSELKEERIQLAKLVRDTTATKQQRLTRQLTTPCSMAESRSFSMHHHLPQEGLVVDSDAPEALETDAPSPTAAAAAAGRSEKRNASLPAVLDPLCKTDAEQQQQHGMDERFICQRCDRPFTDSDEWTKHCRKCHYDDE